MFKNYLRVALRSIKKNKLYAFINIFGLSMGLCMSILISMYVIDEISYDKMHANVEDIYRVTLKGKIAGQEIHTSNSCPPLVHALEEEVAGVEAATRIRTIGDIVFRHETEAYAEQNVVFADPNFFQFFSFPLLEGDLTSVLSEPNTIVLTRKLANKYFPEGDAVGQMLSVGSDRTEYKITGVAENSPSNSHIKFGALLSQVTSERDNQSYQGWTNNFLFTYYRKNKETNLEDIDARLVELVHKYVGDEIAQFMGVSFDEFLAQGNQYEYVSYAMIDTHLYAETDDDMEANGDIMYVYIFSAIGVFILFIACINFMNLSTAKSAGRAKEVGLRKTLGSQRKTLIGQFLAESLMYSMISMVLAVLFAYILLPQFNFISGKEMLFSQFTTPVFVAAVLVIAVIVGLLAGSYPAFYLTSFSPSEVLRGKIKSGMKSGSIRSSLVVFQFWISIVLVICTGVVYQQISFMQEKNLGLDRENVLVISITGKLESNMIPFQNAVNATSEVVSSSFTDNVFPGVNNTTVFQDVHSEQEYLMGSYFSDWDHLATINLTLTEGRFFSRDFPSDSLAVIVNEAAVKEFGWDKGEGKEIMNFFGQNPSKVKVIGVVKDFNFESLKTNIRPMVINFTKTANNLLVKYDGSSEQLLKNIEANWKEFAPGEPLEYAFMDENYDQLFREEQRLGRLFSLFTVLAIFIASLGLFALASFMAEQRTKEIGIRKALGASTQSLTALLSKEFTKLVLISFVLAVFPTWYFMGQWLDGFVYRDTLSVWVFLGAGLLAIITAWLTVGYQALKASVANPVDSLKYE
jgi:putative ABC transport system permease protein